MIHLFAIKQLQPMWEVLHKICQKGMNFGRFDLETNGELWYLKTLPSGSVVLDVGANVGKYAQAAQQIPGAQIHCFEPSCTTFKKLSSNVTGVVLNNVGCGAQESRLTLYGDGNDSTLDSLMRRDLSSKEIEHGKVVQQVKVITLDDYCADFEHIDLLKLDIEGFELEALKGCKTLLQQKKIKRIQFEFGGTSYEARVYVRDFYEMLSDFVFYRLVPNGKIPLGRYSEEYEKFNTNFLCELKG